MNYSIKLDVARTASESDIRKTLKLPADHPVTKQDVVRFARWWQNNLAENNSGSEMIANADVEVGIVFQ